MKKYKFFIVIILMVLFANIDCYASVDTFERTDSNLRVPDSITVNSSNIRDIKNTPSVSSSEKIYDYADLLTVKEEEKLYKKISEFINKNDVDLIILTTNNLNNYSIDDYTYNFYCYNYFNKNAVVFTIYNNTVEPVIYMYNNGDKVASIFTDDVINEILEYVYQNIDTGNYYKAISDYVKIVEGFYDIDGSGSYKVDDFGNLVRQIPWIEIIILSGCLTFVTISWFIYMIKSKNKNSNIPNNIEKNVDGSTLIVKCDTDTLIDVSTHDNNSTNK